ncbi:hypothetical protein [Belliella aquatica]|uniref:Histone H1-like protein Hc1 n=1 Tax=Belliella aquatica TaxID=1323734 RepID=A0ABQ1MCE8_9BACT|nr:hypothetical protein [Belliella aquatica]GGC38143.1 hypothetical protein GCM10010993_16310 [Belliella aquatica]
MKKQFLQEKCNIFESPLIGGFILNYNNLNMSEFNKLKEMLESLEEDFAKFYEKKNNAAGTRVRKGLMEIKNLASEIRKDVQMKKNN